VRYLKIPVHDYNHSVISIFFQEAWDYIEDHNFGKILVHCVLGRSRSCSIMVMYLMKKYRLSFQKV
jgi:dual specificity MAP kinase phosphatase